MELLPLNKSSQNRLFYFIPMYTSQTSNTSLFATEQIAEESIRAAVSAGCGDESQTANERRLQRRLQR